MEILLLEREIHELRLLVEKQSATIEAYSAASESSAVEEAVSAAASVEPVEVEEQVVEKKQPYRSLVNYLVDGDRITHALKESEWCVYYDKEAGELLGSGGIYKSLRSFHLEDEFQVVVKPQHLLLLRRKRVWRSSFNRGHVVRHARTPRRERRQSMRRPQGCGRRCHRTHGRGAITK